LTYSFPSDGVTWGDGVNGPVAPNNLSAQLTALFGALRGASQYRSVDGTDELLPILIVNFLHCFIKRRILPIPTQTLKETRYRSGPKKILIGRQRGAGLALLNKIFSPRQ
jgi:hypothetical protein